MCCLPTRCALAATVLLQGPAGTTQAHVQRPWLCSLPPTPTNQPQPLFLPLCPLSRSAPGWTRRRRTTSCAGEVLAGAGARLPRCWLALGEARWPPSPTNTTAHHHCRLPRATPPPTHHHAPPPRSMRTTARYMRITTLVALLQPAPETFELFDDVMVLSSGKVSHVADWWWAGHARASARLGVCRLGRPSPAPTPPCPHSLLSVPHPAPITSPQIIYHGPCEAVLPFFERLGFACPQRKGCAGGLAGRDCGSSSAG